jgi:hypothetical protein
MKSNAATILVALAVGTVAAFLLFGRGGCSQPGGPSAPTSASAPRVVNQKFAAEGITFEYPQDARVEVAKDNPDLHQIAIDSPKGPGVLTLRYNPSDAGAPIDLNAMADEAKKGLGDGAEAAITPTRIKIAGKDVDGRVLKSTILGFPFSDVVAVVKLGDRNFVVLTHAADEDLPKAKVLFDTVLSTLAAK